MSYPDRPKFHAHQLTRLLFKSCAAQSIGQDAVLLVIHIAHTEDAARYQGPVRFWNSQLNEVLGFRSPKSLNNARQKAVEAGWLHYERKHDRADGKYWTNIPPNVTAFDDEPIEPSTPITIPSTEQKAEQESYGKRNRKVTGNDLLPNPVPVPNPNIVHFEFWWKEYPNKTAKKKGAEAYDKALKRIAKSESISMEAAIAKLLQWSLERFPELKSREPKFVPHASTWLNGERYSDPLPGSQRKASSQMPSSSELRRQQQEAIKRENELAMEKTA